MIPLNISNKEVILIIIILQSDKTSTCNHGFLSDGYFHQMVTQCRYSSKDLVDAEFIHSYVFNQAEYIRFNSTVGKFVGYTEHGVKNADAWNRGPELGPELGELERYCKSNAALAYSAVLDNTGEQGSAAPPTGL
uniref:MHC class II beta chain N-terminal domain-containing protein n=1 Tax=Hucho hucho TaxID=62062 RepID=A0A4W5PIY9_9TELE